ncbi:MAG: carbonic anhydrase family protein [Rhodocyclaceae bacterium]|nr:carbonic anhydrase family protein [Rhodocyclaceae bacterium]
MSRVIHFSAAILAGTCLAAQADWQLVTTSASASAEIDLARITPTKDGKRTAWTRLVFNEPRLDFEGRFRYESVEALQHFDCANARFATRQRIYRLEGRQMASEKVDGAYQSVANGIDAKLFQAVCGTAPPLAGKPRAMHAELVTAGEEKTAQPRKVADTPSPSGKPRFIEIPQIDKSKAEDPFKNAPPSSAGKNEATAPGKNDLTKAEAKTPAPSASTGKMTPSLKPELSRLERERLLATSGPRAQRTKPAEPRETGKPEATPTIAWGYAGAGAPENWSKLKPEYALCGSGKRQSPIDIRGAIRVDLEPIKFDYKPTQFRITDTGHTIEVEVASGNTLTLTGKTYELQRIHFHRPSEERIQGKAFEMSAHFVHQSYEGDFAIVAVLMEKGSEHPQVQTLWNYMPLEVGMGVEPPGVVIDLAKLLPERREYYTYMGSLTTPPCSEGVLWLVLKQPIAVSPEQIAIFARLYPMNARPVQPTHGRLIKESR